MKKLLIIIFILGFSTNVAHSQSYGWMELNPASIQGTPDFSDLYFIDANTGWISCSSINTIFHTTDGGLTFTAQNTALTTNAIHMVSTTEGYCGGESGFVYRTSDGGATWPFLGTITNTLTDITFPPSGGTGYACGFNGAIYSVISTGITAMASGVNGDLSSISFPFNSAEGWVCGGSVIRHYSSGSWVADQFKPSGDYNALFFIDSVNGWSVGDRIIHTEDGMNWFEQINPDILGRAMIDVFFISQDEGWIVGNQGLILHTTNGGTNWTIEGVGLTNALLTGVQFTSVTNGYITGNGKTLLKYTQISAISENERKQSLKIFPNPTIGIIKLNIPDDHHFKFACISDLTGRKIIEFNNLSSNEIDMESVTSGIYSILIVIDKQVFFEKLIKY